MLFAVINLINTLLPQHFPRKHGFSTLRSLAWKKAITMDDTMGGVLLAFGIWYHIGWERLSVIALSVT